jgi:hypothetical protein
METTSATYETLAHIIYPGSDLRGLDYVYVATQLGGGTSMSVRLYDLTNAQQIAEKTGITNTTFSAVDIGTLSNLPTGQAMLEIQALGVGGGRKARVAGLQLYYSAP